MEKYVRNKDGIKCSGLLVNICRYNKYCFYADDNGEI